MSSAQLPGKPKPKSPFRKRGSLQITASPAHALADLKGTAELGLVSPVTETLSHYCVRFNGQGLFELSA
ncbi:hypothetical protein AAFF_G00143180 [Aldrovandia affinis]|uniref:Uncharacterized protein n=1 Tax=Aldrovandia affinis TaxID=143900 RepID=A0AAD7T0B8_9TELE|nr:hypothetical protein AAFF_G00143180 [Aldrovandia affinis]